MSKYNQLWNYIKTQDKESLTLSFDEIEKFGNVAIDHSFLTYKKELNDYEFAVQKISMKNKTVTIQKL